MREFSFQAAGLMMALLNDMQTGTTNIEGDCNGR